MQGEAPWTRVRPATIVEVEVERGPWERRARWWLGSVEPGQTYPGRLREVSWHLRWRFARLPRAGGGAGQKTQRGSNKLTDKQQRTHGQTASLRFQVELRDHSRNQRCQPLGSAAPSFSGRRLCPDLRRKATNCPRLTSRPSHCCSQTSPSPIPSGRTRARLPERRARRWLGSVEQGQIDPGCRHPGTCGVVEDTDWPGPGHVTIRSRARVSCSWWISGGDSSSTPHWSPDQREGSCQVALRDHSRNQRCQPLGSAAPSFSGRRLCPDLRRKATNCPRLTSRPSHCCSQTSPSPIPSGRTRARLPERRARRARRWLGSVEQGQIDPGCRHPGTCGVVEDTDWPGPGHVTIRSRARVSCSWWVSGGDSSSTPHWSPDQREGSCQTETLPSAWEFLIGLLSFQQSFMWKASAGHAVSISPDDGGANNWEDRP
ncbi:uncharacterized protein LOC122431618 [Cervus canadensis]|uniref:uncharacterized protein LOC122431618 n=1 Tax=Cervus canadensis TaxID=1574408 RepID=UPI001CA314D0|nr:uncharacterized protein LOC122431618 [Cervus canadensis]